MSEKYTFSFTTEEIKEINNEVTNHKKVISLQVFFVVIFICLVVLTMLSRMVSNILFGVFIGALFVYSVVLLFSYIVNKRGMKIEFTRIADSTYRYEFFDNYVEITITDKITTRNVTIYYSDITSVKKCTTLYRIQYGDLCFFLREKDLVENAKIKTL